MEKRLNVIQIDPQNPEIDLLGFAGNLIRQGKIVAFPTETVYGLGANTYDDVAVKRVFAVKNRPSNDPAIVHIAHLSQLSDVAIKVSSVARLLASHFWPGPLTMVLPKHNNIPDSVTASLPTVGVRMPKHPVASGLVRAAGVPIAAPSANLFTRTSSTTARHVIEDLGDRVDLIIDSGEATLGIESTVIAIFDREVRLLRPGATDLEDISYVLKKYAGDVLISLKNDNSSLSPGLSKKHYSPKAKVFFFDGPKDAVRASILNTINQEVKQNKRVGLLLPDEDIQSFRSIKNGLYIYSLGKESDLHMIARNLYAGMRHLDAIGVDSICIRSFGIERLGRALMDRITRAAEGVVIKVR